MWRSTPGFNGREFVFLSPGVAPFPARAKGWRGWTDLCKRACETRTQSTRGQTVCYQAGCQGCFVFYAFTFILFCSLSPAWLVCRLARRSKPNARVRVCVCANQNQSLCHAKCWFCNVGLGLYQISIKSFRAVVCSYIIHIEVGTRKSCTKTIGPTARMMLWIDYNSTTLCRAGTLLPRVFVWSRRTNPVVMIMW